MPVWLSECDIKKVTEGVNGTLDRPMSYPNRAVHVRESESGADARGRSDLAPLIK
jgi:hypothetical protein